MSHAYFCPRSLSRIGFFGRYRRADYDDLPGAGFLLSQVTRSPVSLTTIKHSSSSSFSFVSIVVLDESLLATLNRIDIA